MVTQESTSAFFALSKHVAYSYFAYVKSSVARREIQITLLRLPENLNENMRICPRKAESIMVLEACILKYQIFIYISLNNNQSTVYNDNWNRLHQIQMSLIISRNCCGRKITLYCGKWILFLQWWFRGYNFVVMSTSNLWERYINFVAWKALHDIYRNLASNRRPEILTM